MNPSMEPSVSSETRWENVLFSIVLNHNPLDSGEVLKRYNFYSVVIEQTPVFIQVTPQIQIFIQTQITALR